MTCSGDATRFAASLGIVGPVAVAKHLQKIGGRSVLQRSIDSLITNIGVSGITFTLNPLLAERYIQYLQEIQPEYSKVDFSYTVRSAVKQEGFCDGVRRSIREGVYKLDGQVFDIGNPIMVLTHGDAIFKISQIDRMRQKIAEYSSFLERGGNLMVVTGGMFSGTVYYLGQIDSLSDHYYGDGLNAGRYGLEFWNINTVQDLNEARKSFGVSAEEISPFTRRKESE
jgi:hypothetical protein